MKRQVECIHCQHTENEDIHFCNKTKKEVKSYKCSKGNCKYCEFKPLAAIPIGRCDECPLVEVRRTMGAGDAYDYFCGKTKDKIVGYVEWDCEIPPVPLWCPFYIKEN